MTSSIRPQLNVAIVAPSMRILGGQAVQAERLLRGWRDDTEIAASLVPTNPLPTGPLRRALDIKYLRTVATQLTFWPLLVRELRHADVVHSFSASYTSFVLSTLPAVLVAKALRRPVIVHYHSGEAPDHLRRSALARYVLGRMVDANAVPSRFLHEVFARFDIPSHVIANTVDTTEFAYRSREPGGYHLLSTRNFEPHYNVACTLRAFQHVQRASPAARLTLVGGGSQEGLLRQLAADLQLKHVTFAGRVPPHEIARYYAAADIYVQSPSIDNMPLSILEAYASGCPVVSTDVGGVPAILTHDVSGLLAADDDHPAIAAHVLRLIQDPALGARLSAAGHERCAGYTWDAVRRDWVNLYRSLVRSAALPAPTPA
jgi:glycosyltransferase involved in cell wall biosynthesis